MVESIVFTSQFSEKELLAKIRKQKGLMLGCGYPFFIAFAGFELFIPASGIFLIIVGSHEFYGVSILAIITMLGFEIYFLSALLKMMRLMRKSAQAFPNMRNNISSKEFAWDADTQQFRYKDKERSIRFKSSDVRKWCIRKASLLYNGLIAIRLNNDEQIILEEIFNPVALTFLSEHAEELHLPPLLKDQGLIDPYSELI